jgi:H+/Cl- antiporter ClcA
VVVGNGEHAPGTAAVTAPATATPADPLALLRSRNYLVLLILAAILGVPISVGAYWFLELTSKMQRWAFTDLPHSLGLDAVPLWWPLPVLGIAGLLVALVIRVLPGGGGESPAGGFHAGGGLAPPAALPGILLAAVVSIGLGAVIGPEAPLIALG